MVALTKLLWLAFTATTATASVIGRHDAITVQNDIAQEIGPSWATLNNDVNGFPAPPAYQAQQVSNKILSL
jgi:hypothetical protein